MKTQNMIVLTVEFTRIPLSGRGEAAYKTSVTELQQPLLDAGILNEVTENTTSSARTSTVFRRDEQYPPLYSEGLETTKRSGETL